LINATMTELDLPFVQDTGLPYDPIGVTWSRSTARLLNSSYAKRQTSYEMYVKPLLSRPDNNIELLSQTTVTKIIFDDHRSAIGVEIKDLLTGNIQKVKSKKAVISSAGVLGSPKLLLLSGIGTNDDLCSIPKVTNNNHIGKTLQTHFRMTPIAGFTDSNPLFALSYLDVWPGDAFDGPSNQLILDGFSILSGEDVESVGKVYLNCTNPSGPIILDFKLFDKPEDLDNIVNGYRLYRKAVRSPIYAPYFGGEFVPGSNGDNDNTLKDFIRNTTSVHHMFGSLHRAVDSKLRVKGTKNLFVIDGSIIPKVRGPDNGCCLLMGEIGANIVIDLYK